MLQKKEDFQDQRLEISTFHISYKHSIFVILNFISNFQLPKIWRTSSRLRSRTSGREGAPRPPVDHIRNRTKDRPPPAPQSRPSSSTQMLRWDYRLSLLLNLRKNLSSKCSLLNYLWAFITRHKVDRWD